MWAACAALVFVSGHSESPAELSVPPVAMAAEGAAATEDAETVLPPPMDCRLCWLIRSTMKGSLQHRRGLLSRPRPVPQRQQMPKVLRQQMPKVLGTHVKSLKTFAFGIGRCTQVLHMQIHASGTRDCIWAARRIALVAPLPSRAFRVDCLNVPAGIIPDKDAIYAILAARAVLHASRHNVYDNELDVKLTASTKSRG